MHLWQASEKFHADFDLLVTQKSVTLNVEEFTTFKTCCLLNICSSLSCLTNSSRLGTISYSALWDLLYYTGYLTVDEFPSNLVCGSMTSPH
jgi:hypothetical protein